MAVSTLASGAQAVWIAGTCALLFLPHAQLARRLLLEWAKFDFRQTQYERALDLLEVRL